MGALSAASRAIVFDLSDAQAEMSGSSALEQGEAQVCHNGRHPKYGQTPACRLGRERQRACARRVHA